MQALQLTIAEISTQTPNWWRESYTLVVIGAILTAGLVAIKASRPLVESILRIQEERTKQEMARQAAAASVERTAPEMTATAKELGRIGDAQAEHAVAQATMTENLIRLHERMGRDERESTRRYEERGKPG